MRKTLRLCNAFSKGQPHGNTSYGPTRRRQVLGTTNTQAARHPLRYARIRGCASCAQNPACLSQIGNTARVRRRSRACACEACAQQITDCLRIICIAGEGPVSAEEAAAALELLALAEAEAAAEEAAIVDEAQPEGADDSAPVSAPLHCMTTATAKHDAGAA